MTTTQPNHRSINGQTWEFWRDKIHLVRWQAFVAARSTQPADYDGYPKTPLDLLCIVGDCRARMLNTVNGEPQQCDLSVGTITVGGASFPPGHTSGSISVRSDDGESFMPAMPVSQGQPDMRERAARELASVASEWVLRSDWHGVGDVCQSLPRTFQEAVVEVLVECWAILMQKRYQRGTANLTEQGIVGILNRAILDKGQRLLREAKRDAWIIQGVQFGIDQDTLDKAIPKADTAESFEDDLQDNVNYHILALLLRAGYLELPYDGETYGLDI